MYLGLTPLPWLGGSATKYWAQGLGLGDIHEDSESLLRTYSWLNLDYMTML